MKNTYKILLSILVLASTCHQVTMGTVDSKLVQEKAIVKTKITKKKTTNKLKLKRNKPKKTKTLLKKAKKVGTYFIGIILGIGILEFAMGAIKFWL